jgi:hypothetical protein
MGLRVRRGELQARVERQHCDASPPRARRGHGLYQPTRKANCKILGSHALVIRSKLPAVSVELGTVRFTRLNALNASSRDVIITRSVKRKFFARPRSTVAYPGPRTCSYPDCRKSPARSA